MWSMTKKQRSHFFSRFGLVVVWWTMRKSSSAYTTCKKLYALLCWCLWREKWSMTKKNRGHTFFQDLDWLSCGERCQSLHLLVWHLRSCMLCSAISNNMRSDQWQTISVFFAHTLSQDLDWLSLDNNAQVFIWWYEIKEVVALPL